MNNDPNFAAFANYEVGLASVSIVLTVLALIVGHYNAKRRAKTRKSRRVFRTADAAVGYTTSAYLDQATSGKQGVTVKSGTPPLIKVGS